MDQLARLRLAAALNLGLSKLCRISKGRNFATEATCQAAQAHRTRRVRQHVNPLRSQYTKPFDARLIDWKAAYSDTKLPLHLDLGCGPGLFLTSLAHERHNFNYLGVDIKEEYVHRALCKLDPGSKGIACLVKPSRLISKVRLAVD